jgi:hypothetical protein
MKRQAPAGWQYPPQGGVWQRLGVAWPEKSPVFSDVQAMRGAIICGRTSFAWVSPSIPTDPRPARLRPCSP